MKYLIVAMAFLILIVAGCGIIPHESAVVEVQSGVKMWVPKGTNFTGGIPEGCTVTENETTVVVECP